MQDHPAVRKAALQPKRTAALIHPALVPTLRGAIVEVEARATTSAGRGPVLHENAAVEIDLDTIRAGWFALRRHRPRPDPEVVLAVDGRAAVLALTRRRRGLCGQCGNRNADDRKYKEKEGVSNRMKNASWHRVER